MRKVQANPDNLPFGEFDEFDLAQGAAKAEPKRLYGKLKTICAHAPSAGLRVEYLKIQDLEILSQEEKPKHGKAAIRFAVSFRVQFRLLSADGKTVPPPASEDADLTRVRYWNFGEKDFHRLNFLRSAADKILFIAASDAPTHLFGIAAEYLGHDTRVEKAAQERGIRLLLETDTDEKAMRGLRNYIAALLQNGGAPDAATTISAYRRIDRHGEAGSYLARLLHSEQQPPSLVAEILIEAVSRLLRDKPRNYSVHLGGILDFVCAEKFAKPSAEQLLWQTYLAASAERELPVLKRVWMRAVRMKADRETLRLIYNTWRGFAEPRRSLENKTPPHIPSRS